MRKSYLLKGAFYGLVFLLVSQHAWAEKITVKATKTYGYPLPYQVADLDEYASNVATAWQQKFDKCMAIAQAQGGDYWFCQKYRVIGKAPDRYIHLRRLKSHHWHDV
ncbi:hypothetical protein MNBD_GAMMA15-810 [hydrothermal vent metagenome]|uniref:Uncharacterized protein n=2 Tax=hydrothermal vent metagenome TaxID=652676 RepID=A0A3B0YMX2_9ZZZZ